MTITNDNPVMAQAMLCVQEACAVAIDRVLREKGGYAVLRCHLSSIYGDRDLKINVHGPWPTVIEAEKHARRLQGHTFVLGGENE